MRWFIGMVFLAGLVAGCGDFQRPWHELTLPSGRVVKVTSFNLVWGVEHDERTPAHDCLALEFVSTQPQADFAAREKEAREVFELVRGASETWGFKTATVAGFANTERKGHYDLFVFTRLADGSWSVERQDRKVFVND